jgi:hypothetical protein
MIHARWPAGPLRHCATLQKVQQIAAHELRETTKHYDRRPTG